MGRQRRSDGAFALAASVSRLRGSAVVTSDSTSASRRPHLVHRPVDGRLVGLRRPVKSAQLANELQRGVSNLGFGRRRPEVEQRPDVPAHRRWVLSNRTARYVTDRRAAARGRPVAFRVDHPAELAVFRVVGLVEHLAAFLAQDSQQCLEVLDPVIDDEWRLCLARSPRHRPWRSTTRSCRWPVFRRHRSSGTRCRPIPARRSRGAFDTVHEVRPGLVRNKIPPMPVTRSVLEVIVEPSRNRVILSGLGRRCNDSARPRIDAPPGPKKDGRKRTSARQSQRVTLVTLFACRAPRGRPRHRSSRRSAVPNRHPACYRAEPRRRR